MGGKSNIHLCALISLYSLVFVLWGGRKKKTPGDGDFLSVSAAQLQGVLVGSLVFDMLVCNFPGMVLAVIYAACACACVFISTTITYLLHSHRGFWLLVFSILPRTPGMLLGMWICSRLDVPSYDWTSTRRSRTSQAGGVWPYFSLFSSELHSWDALTSPTRLFQVTEATHKASKGCFLYLVSTGFRSEVERLVPRYVISICPGHPPPRLYAPRGAERLFPQIRPLRSPSLDAQRGSAAASSSAVGAGSRRVL